MSAIQDHRIGPSDISKEELEKLRRLVEGDRRASLLGPDGEQIELPEPLNEMLLFIVQAMTRKQAIFLMPEDEAFTTQAAANFLGMSRPYLLRLLEAKKLPFHRVGTHRRILFRDLVEFQTKRSVGRNQAISKMTEDLVEAGLYDQYVETES